MTDDLFLLLQPAVLACGLELIDVEPRAGVVMVTVDRVGGVDLEALTEANRVVSAVLDEHDPISGSYTLEVSSPGIERRLRTPAHFAKAVGETVSVKTRPPVAGPRRVTGELSVADSGGFELTADDVPGGRIRLAYSDVDWARTVFAWGSDPRSGGGKSDRGPTTATTTKKRKQVTTP
ncbi:MAG: ribosome maturation factor RimP [Acidimicrobiales bacterium]